MVWIMANEFLQNFMLEPKCHHFVIRRYICKNVSQKENVFWINDDIMVFRR